VRALTAAPDGADECGIRRSNHRRIRVPRGWPRRIPGSRQPPVPSASTIGGSWYCRTVASSGGNVEDDGGPRHLEGSDAGQRLSLDPQFPPNSTPGLGRARWPRHGWDVHNRARALLRRTRHPHKNLHYHPCRHRSRACRLCAVPQFAVCAHIHGDVAAAILPSNLADDRLARRG
jgi:hypothetical protein